MHATAKGFVPKLCKCFCTSIRGGKKTNKNGQKIWRGNKRKI